MKVLITGAGIAGLTLALCLRRRGHEVLLIERSPRLRDEGYMIDFFSAGYDAAERLGLLPDLAAIHYPIARLAFLAPDGSEKVSVPYPSLRRLFEGRHFNFMRGDLERILYQRLPEGAPVRFGTTITGLEQAPDYARVLLSDRSIERVDLLVGADGMHSQVRGLAFGREEGWFPFLDYHTAAYVIGHAEIARRLGDAFHTLTVPGRQVGVYPLRGGRVAAFFVHRAAGPDVPTGPESAMQALRSIYGDLGWLVPELLELGPADGSVYYDTVSQVVTPAWSRGRIALIGDAAWCVSLLAGQGASLAMAGAYVLAEELAVGDDVPAALGRYERRLRPSVKSKQRAGRRMARWFVPKSRLGIDIRDVVLRMADGAAGRWLIKRQLAADSLFGPGE